MQKYAFIVLSSPAKGICTNNDYHLDEPYCTADTDLLVPPTLSV